MRNTLRHSPMLVLIALGACAPGQAEPGFHKKLYERYCDKAREGPEAYVQFVRRMYTVTGLVINDFVPEHRGARVVHDCGLAPERTAELQRVIYAKADR